MSNQAAKRLIATVFAMYYMLLAVPAVQAATDCTDIVTTTIPQSECESLLYLYNNTNGPGWTNKTGWNVTNTPCTTWYGVSCTVGNVTTLSLSNNKLSGLIPTLPNFNLPNLTELFLANNQLYGAIPDFTNMPLLTKLDLGNNQLTGTIPDFTNMPLLTELWLLKNQLTGTIPDFTNMPLLTKLSLGNNQLSGGVPNFTNLSSLTFLSLSSNQLSGTIPNFTNMPLLTELWLGSNQFSGAIPNFTNLTNLDKLGIDVNQLSGAIPNFTSLSNLTFLDLNSNQLSGTITNFTNLSNLTKLYLYNNRLSGAIPNFTNLPLLTELHLYNNQLSGAIPNFTSLLNLTILSLHDNQLSGAIPNLALPSLTEIKLSNNQLSGTVPNLNWSGFSNFLLNNNCGLTAYDTAQATVLSSKDPNWQQLNSVCFSALSLKNISAISATTALITATATGTGITERGFYWWNANDSSGYLPAGTGAGDFSLMLTGLKPQNTYNIKAYIKVGDLIISSDALTFTTKNPQIPVVHTSSAFTLTGSDIDVSGEITDVGGSPILIYGFVYANHPVPTVWDNALAFAWDTGLPLSTGKPFSGTIRNLAPGTYYLRAYAHNDTGTAYGEEITFTIYAPGFTVQPVTLTTSESGGSATFTVKINTQPTADVTLSLISTNTAVRLSLQPYLY